MDRLRPLLRLASDSHTKYPLWLVPAILLCDSLLCVLILLRVPYTEIDWKAYMEQVALYLSGERDYTAIKGGTGPLVYPAAHVYIYSALHSLTSGGTDIFRAQCIFAGLYVCTLAIVLLCYREAKAPPYILPLLMLSKRLHSIYMLRLFNDPFAIFLLWVGVFCMQKRWWTASSVAYSLALGVKMNVLLVLPGVGVIYLLSLGRNQALAQAAIMGIIQLLLSLPFALPHPHSYLSRAFEFTRQFLHEWTVNWRFVDEPLFQSRGFALGLLLAHGALLLLFLSTTWKKPAGRCMLMLTLFPPSPVEQKAASRRVTPRYVLATVLTANTIGMLCARSLHYQFFSWLAWGSPFLLWRSGLGPAWVLPLWAAQEWAWNVFPSSNASSAVVVGVLAATTVGVWGGEMRESARGRGKKEV